MLPTEAALLWLRVKRHLLGFHFGYGTLQTLCGKGVKGLDHEALKFLDPRLEIVALVTHGSTAEVRAGA